MLRHESIARFRAVQLNRKGGSSFQNRKLLFVKIALSVYDDPTKFDFITYEDCQKSRFWWFSLWQKRNADFRELLNFIVLILENV